MTCLIAGASFNVDGYYHGVSVEPFYMAFNEGDNNNGITIFDITDLNHVHYCFVDYCGMESDREVELMTPLSARTYLEAYYVLDGSDERTEKIGLIPLVEKFQGRDLVTVIALKETWPHGEWQKDGCIFEEDDLNYADSTTAATAGPSVGNKQTEQSETKSLRDHSMNSLMEQILDPGKDNSDLIAEVEVLNDFLPKLRHRLYDQAATLQPTTSFVNLLHKALEQDIEVDLSVFEKFDVEDLSMLVAKLRGGKMRALNLSNMPELNEPDLQLILGTHQAPSEQSDNNDPTSVVATGAARDLSTIILLETPKISIDFLTEHLGHYDLYHSDLFRRPMYTEGPGDDAYYGRRIPLQALQFASANTVSQLAWVGIPSRQSCDSKLRLEDGHFDWSNLKYSIEASSRFSGDEGLKFKNFLLDVPSPAAKTIHSLRRLMQYLTSGKIGWLEDWPKAAARCFATTSTLEDGVGYSVGPFSTTLYRDDDQEDYVQSGKGLPLKTGQWAIILVHEAFDARDQESLDKRELEMVSMFGPRGSEELKQWPAEEKEPNFKPLKRLRYALAKALPESSTEPFLITDVPGYVEHVLGSQGGDAVKVDQLKEWWMKQNPDATGSGYYEDDDMHKILHKIYLDEATRNASASRPRPIDPFEDIMRMMTIAQRQDG
ncbi:MAG: hypothetical protein LQ343_002980 [Gyalolechia ehrenbergii]|nr:MAG: hypothetical protein LQ343_002980 [Gyalolechia ehrenbergii]